MEIISLVGIVVGLIVFILCCVKGVNTLIAGFIGSFVIILTSGGNILEGVTGTYLAGLSGFIKSYFLLFALGALFGKCLSACGGSRRIALAVYHVIEHMGSKNKRFKTALFVPIMYMIMSYVGVSGFVVVYTVLDIAKHVYRKNDVPWRMFTYGGATFLVTMVLPGNLQLNNIAAAGFCGTTVTAAPLLGLCCGVALIVIDFLVIFWDAKRSEKNGEGFMDTGAAFVASDPDADSELDTDTSSLPSLVQAVIPLVVMIVLAAVVKLHIVICLAVGIILCFVVMPGRIKNPMETITVGITNSIGQIMGVASASAVGTCLKAAAGYTVIMSGLATLPSVLGGTLMILVMSFCAASSTGGLNPVGADAFALFTAGGLTPATSHRLMTLCALTSVPPQSAGIVNTCNILKVPYKKAFMNWQRLSYIGGLPVYIVVMILIQLGIVV